MSYRQVKFDVVVVGGGPAGMAAAFTVSQKNRSVVLLESTPWLGGQIWRHGDSGHTPKSAKKWMRRIEQSPVDVRLETTVVAAPHPKKLLAESPQGNVEIEYKKLIIATGAREVFVPFPGWTLPNVFGVGGLHNLAKLGWNVRGKRIVVAGSGPLMFAVAGHLRMSGAKVILLAEQADMAGLMGFGTKLPFLAPSKIVQAAFYQTVLLGVPYKTHCWPVEALGGEQLEAVRFTNQKKTWDIPCDYLACAFGLTANLELPHLLGCQIADESVQVDSYQRTSVPDVYCVGELTGVAGVGGALVEGRIAGYSAGGDERSAQKLLSERDRSLKFAKALADSFKLRDELRFLAQPDTVVCRCEDVTVNQILENSTLREAKLYHHVGMGPCQGRTCGNVLRFLFSWQPGSVRPPLYPAKAETLKYCEKCSQEAPEKHS